MEKSLFAPMTFLTTFTASIRPVTTIRRDRLWEVDVLRGVAILMMVIYHLVWDLYGLAGWHIDMYGAFWSTWQRITAGLFIFLVGVSLHLRTQRQFHKGAYRIRPFINRALVVFTWGLVISLATFLFQPAEYVRFGILHFIGTAMLLAFPLARFSWPNLFLGGLFLFLPHLTSWRHTLSWAEWVGLAQAPHPAFDYFPLIPWFGLVLLGIFAGHLIFPQGRRRLRVPSPAPRYLDWLQLAGQNSLLLYLIHQPLLILVLTLLGVIPW